MPGWRENGGGCKPRERLSGPYARYSKRSLLRQCESVVVWNQAAAIFNPIRVEFRFLQAWDAAACCSTVRKVAGRCFVKALRAARSSGWTCFWWPFTGWNFIRLFRPVNQCNGPHDSGGKSARLRDGCSAVGVFARSESVCGEFPAKLFNDHLRIDGGCECPENVGICFEKDPFWGY